MKLFVDYVLISLKMMIICILGALAIYGIASALPRKTSPTYMVLGFPAPISPEVFLPHPIPPPTQDPGPNVG